MKKKYWVLPLLMGSFLVSCGGSAQPVASSEIVSSSEEQEDPLPELSNVEYDLSVSIDGYLNDLMIGVSGIVGMDYKLYFDFSVADITTAKVTTDRPAVATAEKLGDVWTLHFHKKGKTHLIITDGDEIIHLRQVVEAKPEVTAEDMPKYLSTVDHWSVQSGWSTVFGNWSCTFFDDGYATMAGRESGGVNLTGASFTIEKDDSVIEGGVYSDGKWVGFAVKNWTLQDFNLYAIVVYKTGDMMHVHTNNALLGILSPQNVL